jgi:hypothetical protein
MKCSSVATLERLKTAEEMALHSTRDMIAAHTKRNERHKTS